MSYYKLAEEIHADNVKAGWWTDINTGESILETRNRPEMLMLTVSELSEACEAWAESAPDDKLPQYPGFDVELADAAIRIYDQLGAAKMGGMAEDEFNNAVNEQRDTFTPFKPVPSELMLITNEISKAMEGWRKRRNETYVVSLIVALGSIYRLSDYYRIADLGNIITEKRNFNASRADHKIENRLKDGGKAF